MRRGVRGGQDMGMGSARGGGRDEARALLAMLALLFTEAMTRRHCIGGGKSKAAAAAVKKATATIVGGIMLVPSVAWWMTTLVDAMPMRGLFGTMAEGGGAAAVGGGADLDADADSVDMFDSANRLLRTLGICRV